MNDRPGSADSRAGTDFGWIEAALADLAGAIDVAPTPDIAAAVGRRLAARRAARQAWWPWRPLPRAAALALLVLLVVAVLAVAAIGLGLPGLRIVFVEVLPTPSIVATIPPETASATPSAPSAPSATAPTPPGTGSPSAPAAPPSPSATTVDLGSLTTLAAARKVVDFRLYVPAVSAVGSAAPNVFLDSAVPEGRVALVYPPDPAGPVPSPMTVDGSGRLIGLVITESHGSIDEGYLQKTLGPGTTVQPVTVNGRAGWWIAGRPHTLITVDSAGNANPETLRDIGDVLAWVQGGTLIRIESPRGLAETLRVAQSMQ